MLTVRQQELLVEARREASSAFLEQAWTKLRDFFMLADLKRVDRLLEKLRGEDCRGALAGLDHGEAILVVSLAQVALEQSINLGVATLEAQLRDLGRDATNTRSGGFEVLDRQAVEGEDG